jgi:hypothetical protein
MGVVRGSSTYPHQLMGQAHANDRSSSPRVQLSLTFLATPCIGRLRVSRDMIWVIIIASVTFFFLLTFLFSIQTNNANVPALLLPSHMLAIAQSLNVLLRPRCTQTIATLLYLLYIGTYDHNVPLCFIFEHTYRTSSAVRSEKEVSHATPVSS